jgi:hypothetical protein
VDAWPFEDPKNLAVITVTPITKGDRPILRVSHDEDGIWQFLAWDTPREDEASIVSLLYMTVLDPSVCELADLPRGWRAVRGRREAPWDREPIRDATNGVTSGL